MRVLKDVYLKFTFDKKLLFTVNAGETGRGIRVHLEEPTENKRFKNFIKIGENIYETEIDNVTDTTFDIMFPSLNAGEYLGEMQVIESDDRIKSGIYRILVLESITAEEAETLKAVDAQAVLDRLNEAEEQLKDRINLLDKAIEGKSGLSAYQIWLNNGNQGTEEDFLESLKGETIKYNFILDNEGNLFVDIN